MTHLTAPQTSSGFLFVLLLDRWRGNVGRELWYWLRNASPIRIAGLPEFFLFGFATDVDSSLRLRSSFSAFDNALSAKSPARDKSDSHNLWKTLLPNFIRFRTFLYKAHVSCDLPATLCGHSQRENSLSMHLVDALDLLFPSFNIGLGDSTFPFPIGQLLPQFQEHFLELGVTLVVD